MAQLSKFEQWWLDAWPHRLHLRRYVPKFLHACPEPFRGQVLEVGVGSGWTSRSILETFPQVELTATDIDEKVERHLARLKGRYGHRLHVQQADVRNLPFDRASFDMVIAFYVMHHIDDVAQALQQFMRVLRPGGLLGIADENQRYVVGPLKHLWPANNRLPKEEIMNMVAAEATIVSSAGDVHFHVWAQKAYPF